MLSRLDKTTNCSMVAMSRMFPVDPGLISNYGKFAIIKSRVINLFPDLAFNMSVSDMKSFCKNRRGQAIVNKYLNVR